MLISHVGEVINTLDVIPEPFFWKFDSRQRSLDYVLWSGIRVPLLLARLGLVNISERDILSSDQYGSS